MSNTSKVQGLTPVQYLSGAEWTGQARLYYIDGTTDTNAYYPGDPVALVDGLDAQSGIQTISLATAGAPMVGAVIAIGASSSLTTSYRGGPYINPANLTLTSAPATKTQNYYALVADDPNIIFMIQEGGTGTLLTKAATSKNANFAYAAPATGVSWSGVYLDNGTAPAAGSGGAAYNLRIFGLAQYLDNGAWNTFGAYAKWLVLINSHQYRTMGTVTSGYGF